MREFKLNYPTVGTSALIPSEDPIAHASAVIIEYPINKKERQLRHPNCNYSSWVTGELLNTLACGVASGKAFDVKGSEAMCASILLGIVLVCSAFLSI